MTLPTWQIAFQGIKTPILGGIGEKKFGMAEKRIDPAKNSSA